MSRFNRVLFSITFVATLLGLSSRSWALTQATGVNLTADESFGAREQGMGLTRAGFQTGADAVVNSPASMNDVNDLTFSTAHLEQFEAAQFDNISLLVPWHENATFGIALARYGVNNVEDHGTAIPDSILSEFGTSDWLISGSFARRWGNFDLGGTADILYRNLGDQSGMGLRADAMGQYTFANDYRAGLFIRGIVPSTAGYQSGWVEYEPPEASVFFTGRWDLPYFYGKLEASYESPGLVQKGARSANELEGDRAITDPGSLFKTSKAGAEFRFDFGLALRAGLEALDPNTLSSSIRLGAGYGWHNIVGIDYAFSAHPDLGQSHRIALWWTPSFPKFEGRNYRPHSRVTAPKIEEQSPEEQPGSKSPEAPESEDTDKSKSKNNGNGNNTNSDTDKGGGKEILEDN